VLTKGSKAALAGIQKFKMLARYLILVLVVERQLCRRDFNQRGIRTRPTAEVRVSRSIAASQRNYFSIPVARPEKRALDLFQPVVANSIEPSRGNFIESQCHHVVIGQYLLLARTSRRPAAPQRAFGPEKLDSNSRHRMDSESHRQSGRRLSRRNVKHARGMPCPCQSQSDRCERLSPLTGRHTH
jgi:hypothetical protein